MPNLIANTEEEVNHSYYTDDIELKSRVVAKNTSFYDQANITHKLPCFVNDVDSNIDFRTTELEHLCDTFRDQSVNILNMVSTDSKMTPQMAFRNFMVRLIKKIDNIFPESPACQQWVLSYYKEVVISYLKQNDDPTFIKRLMFDPHLDLPIIAQALRQKIHYELILLNKIGEIQDACGGIMNGMQYYDEAINCLLTLGMDSGRLALLQDKTSHLTDTQEGYCNMGLKIQTIIQEATRIICNDPELLWMNFPHNFMVVDLANFDRLVNSEILKKSNKKRINNVNLIALRILWTVAKNLLPRNTKLTTFLCFTTDQALKLMREQHALARNVKACLRDENVKNLLMEVNRLLTFD